MLCSVINFASEGATVLVVVIGNEDVVVMIENTGINLSKISQITGDSILPVRINGSEKDRTAFYFTITRQKATDTGDHSIVVKSRVSAKVSSFYAEIRKQLQYHSSCPEKMALLSKVYSPADAAFLQKIYELIFVNIANELFDADSLAEKFFLCRAQVFRKQKLLKGKAAAAYIKWLPLQNAKNTAGNN